MESNTLKLQKSIYRNMVKRASELEGETSLLLKKYKQDQHKSAKRNFTKSGPKGLMSSIERSQVIFLGDFHTFDQFSKNLQRILKKMLKEDTKFALGVEIVHGKHQEVIDQYLSHYITELEFLEEINYHDSWRFPWTHYRQFFQGALQHNFPILALNSTGDLQKRDRFAAGRIADFLKQNPERKLLVLFGELHIVKDKLPSQLEQALNEDISYTIIHQNLDEVYWKTIDQMKDPEDQVIVKFSDYEFSLQNSAPWIKYESMIYWYENICDDPEFDIHEYLTETGMMTLNSTVPDNFYYLSTELSKMLGLNFSSLDLEDFNLYDHYQLELIIKKIGTLPKGNLINFFKKLVETGTSFRLPFSKNFYCSSYSINRISFLAGAHIFDIYCRNKDSNYQQVLIHHSNTKKFLYFFHQTLISYFCSKIINPYRKCDLYKDFLRRTEVHFKLSIKVLDDQNFNPTEYLKGHKILDIYLTARTLGLYIGEALYNENPVNNNFYEFHHLIFNEKIKLEIFQQLLEILLSKESFKEHEKRLF